MLAPIIKPKAQTIQRLTLKNESRAVGGKQYSLADEEGDDEDEGADYVKDVNIIDWATGVVRLGFVLCRLRQRVLACACVPGSAYPLLHS